MEQQIFIPDIGDYSGVEVIEVLVKSGDELKKDDTILILETDKATMDIPAPMDLIISKIHIKAGDKVSKGTLMATVSVSATAPTTTVEPANSTSSFPLLDDVALNKNTISNTNLTGFNNASPKVRKFARELGVDLGSVSGTSKHGRISENDVKVYVNRILSANINNFDKSSSMLNNNIDFNKWGNTIVQPLSRIKKKSGQYLHRNWLGIPHVTHFETADITVLERYRKEQQKLYNDKFSTNIKLTLLVFLVKATISALKMFNEFNSSLSAHEDSLIIKHYYNIGIAVDTDLGLVVPVIKNAHQKNIIELAQELITISQKARDNKLGAEDLQGGSFTISSLGGVGGCNFTPIINAPEVAILGVSRSKVIPSYINDELQPRLTLPLALSYDHRVIDGVAAAKFSKFIVEQLEDPKNFYE